MKVTIAEAGTDFRRVARRLPPASYESPSADYECPDQRTESTRLEHDTRVHYVRMKNITLSADEQLIEQARLLAKSRHKTLNAMFREWLEQFTAQSGGAQEFDALMKRLKHVQAGSRFSRDEMNER